MIYQNMPNLAVIYLISRSIVICYLFPWIINSKKQEASVFLGKQMSLKIPCHPGCRTRMPARSVANNVKMSPGRLGCYHSGSCEMTGKLYVQLALSFLKRSFLKFVVEPWRFEKKTDKSNVDRGSPCKIM